MCQVGPISLMLCPAFIRRSTGMSIFPATKATTKAALAAWEITVAMAAPRTPMSKTKMNSGSRAMFSAAPNITDAIPILANP